MSPAPKETYEDKVYYQPRFDTLYSINPDIAAEVVETSVLLGPKVAIQFLTDSLRAIDPAYAGEDGVEALTDETLDSVQSFRGELDAICAILRAYDALVLSYIIHNPLIARRYLFKRLLGID